MGEGKIRKIEIQTQGGHSHLKHGVVPGVTLSNARGSQRDLTNEKHLGMQTGEIIKNLSKTENTRISAGSSSLTNPCK